MPAILIAQIIKVKYLPTFINIMFSFIYSGWKFNSASILKKNANTSYLFDPDIILNDLHVASHLIQQL